MNKDWFPISVLLNLLVALSVAWFLEAVSMQSNEEMHLDSHQQTVGKYHFKIIFMIVLGS
jgi:hypothetical protein